MKRRYSKKPKYQTETALKRIRELFRQADKVFDQDPGLSNRYVELARKISMKYKVRIPSELKKRFCKHCHRFLVPGENCNVRLSKGRIVYTCECGKHMRFPIR